VSVDDLLKWNKLTKKSRLNIGQEIRLSADGAAPETRDEPEPAASEAPSDAAPGGGVHKIAKGETLAVLAKKYGVTVNDLLKWNKLTAKSRLSIGQEIRISGDASAAAPAEPEAQPEPEPEPREEPSAAAPGGTKKVSHVVDRGETTHSIAKKYGVSESDFRKWNSIRAGAQLARGKAYDVYVPQRAAAPEKKKAEAEPASGNAPAGQKQITHTVRRGDNPYVISKKYGVKLEDFLKWNKLNKNAKFQVGEKYVVYVKK
jgi:LysM repeat protein